MAASGELHGLTMSTAVSPASTQQREKWYAGWILSSGVHSRAGLKGSDVKQLDYAVLKVGIK